MNCPNHFVYENTLFSQIDSMTEDEVKSKIVHLLQDPQYSLETKGLYRKLFDLKAHYYLTTNYDYYGHYLCQLGFSHTHRYYDNNECVHSMHRKRVYKHVHDQRKISIFPIHGVAETPKTVMLGFDQYCAVIGRLERYMRLGKGVGKPNAPLYNEYRHWKKKHKNESESYLNYHIDHRASCSDIEFWCETFFTTDVHIVGQGLGFEELDIWWLLHKRKRLKDGISLTRCDIRNTIRVYGYFPPDVIKCLQGLDVDTSCCEEKPSENNWADLYERAIANIHQYIQNH